MTIIVNVLVGIIVLLAYFALGIVISTTVYKRYSASWKYINSNIGEFLFSLGSLPNIIFYLLTWPFQILVSLAYGIPHYTRMFLYSRKRKPAKITSLYSKKFLYSKKRKPVKIRISTKFIDDYDFSSMFGSNKNDFNSLFGSSENQNTKENDHEQHEG